MKSIKIMLVALGLIMLIALEGISSILNVPAYINYQHVALVLVILMIIVGVFYKK